MTTDWWSVKPVGAGERLENDAPPQGPGPQPIPASPAPPPETTFEEERPASGGSRSKAVKVVGGIAGAVVAGSLLLSTVGGDDGKNEKPPASAPVESGLDLPAAGGGVDGEESPQGQGQATDTPETVAPKKVTLTSTPAGKGRVGAIVKLTIRNGTDEPFTALATLIQGDGRPAVVGEGTLAPRARIVNPGETIEGTVEFAVGAAPRQVALWDLSGNLVAASNEG